MPVHELLYLFVKIKDDMELILLRTKMDQIIECFYIYEGITNKNKFRNKLKDILHLSS